MLALVVVFFVPWLAAAAARLRLPALYFEFGAARRLFARAWAARLAGARPAGDFLDHLLELKEARRTLCTVRARLPPGSPPTGTPASPSAERRPPEDPPPASVGLPGAPVVLYADSRGRLSVRGCRSRTRRSLIADIIFVDSDGDGRLPSM